MDQEVCISNNVDQFILLFFFLLFLNFTFMITKVKHHIIQFNFLGFL